MLGFPLARFLAPVGVWAWPVTILLVLGSLGLAAYVWRRQPQELPWRSWARVVAPAVAWLIVCYLVLIAPLLVRGISYTAFRSNASDAYTVMTMAETLRVADWPTITGGVELTEANEDGLRQLAAQSPTSLLSARAIKKPLSLANPAALAWMSSLAGAQVYRFYYAYNALAFLMTMMVALVIGDNLRVGRRFKYLVAGAIAFGFWARFVLETDAGYEMAALPLTLLFAHAWMNLEQQPLRLFSAQRVYLAIVGAALVWVYVPLAIILVVAGLVYYAVSLLQRAVTWRTLMYHGLTIALVVGIWLLTLQIDFVGRNLLYLLNSVENEATMQPRALQVFFTNGAAALWGYPWQALLAVLPAPLQILAAFVMDFFLVFLMLFFAVTVLRILRRTASVPERLVTSFALAGLLLLVAFGLTGSYKPAGKSFTYSFAFLILLTLLFERYNRTYYGLFKHRFVALTVGGWLVTQLALGAFLPMTGVMDGIAGNRYTKDRAALDVHEMLSYLDIHAPTHLALAIPDQVNWSLIMYSQFAFSPYKPDYLGGLLIDNSTDFRNLRLNEIQEAPDYVVVLKDVAGLDYAALGEAVAQNSRLALYKTENRSLDFYRQLTSFFAGLESDDLEFPNYASP